MSPHKPTSMLRTIRPAVIAAGLLSIVASASAVTTQLLIDFGGSTNQTTVDSLSRQWNNVTEYAGGTGVGETQSPSLFTLALKDTTNATSGITFTLNQTFNLGDHNANGFTNLTTAYPASATGNSLFGNVALFNGSSNVVPVFTLSGFTPGVPVDLSFFASRGLTTDNRIARYGITGASTTNLFLEANGSTGSHIVTATGVMPSVSGTITISVNHSTVAESGLPTIGTGDNATGFAYLGVLDIQYTAVPEPSTSAALAAGVVLFGAGALRRRRRA